MWVRPDNSPTWMRNTPTSSKNVASNANTNFLNNERGGIPNGPNQRPNSNKPSQMSQGGSTSVQLMNQNGLNQRPNTNIPSQSQVMTSSHPVGGGGGKNPNSNNNNNNNNMRGTVSTGSMTGNSNTMNQNTNKGSNNKKTDGEVEDYELREFSEELLLKDSNNAARLVTVNLQGMTTSRSTRDEAPLP